MDRGRFQRAVEISSDELHFAEQKPNLVKATIREYVVTIDFQNKTVTHDCADWRKNILGKAFCKHIGKVILSLPEPETTRILQEIQLDRDRWLFQPT